MRDRAASNDHTSSFSVVVSAFVQMEIEVLIFLFTTVAVVAGVVWWFFLRPEKKPFLEITADG